MIRNLQRIQIKIGCDAPPKMNLEPLIAIFARWRAEKDHRAEWVDLADYAHMPYGPGVMLIGHRCYLSLDLAKPQTGILYAARKGLTGLPAERIASAFQAAFELTKRLISEKEFPADVRLRTGSLQIGFTDRLETPNDTSTDHELRPVLREVLDWLFSAHGYDLHPQSDPAECYGFSIAAKKAEPLDTLLGRIAQPAGFKASF